MVFCVCGFIPDKVSALFLLFLTLDIVNGVGVVWVTLRKHIGITKGHIIDHGIISKQLPFVALLALLAIHIVHVSIVIRICTSFRLVWANLLSCARIVGAVCLVVGHSFLLLV